jgi:hypothetical protein
VHCGAIELSVLCSGYPASIAKPVVESGVVQQDDIFSYAFDGK